MAGQVTGAARSAIPNQTEDEDDFGVDRGREKHVDIGGSK